MTKAESFRSVLSKKSSSKPSKRPSQLSNTRRRCMCVVRPPYLQQMNSMSRKSVSVVSEKWYAYFKMLRVSFFSPFLGHICCDANVSFDKPMLSYWCAQRMEKSKRWAEFGKRREKHAYCIHTTDSICYGSFTVTFAQSIRWTMKSAEKPAETI